MDLSPLPCKILVKCQNQASASDLPLYDIFAPQKVPLSKISDDVIACDLWFAPPPPPPFPSSVRRILKRGGPEASENLRTKVRMNIVSLKFSLIFRPKLGDYQKIRSSLKSSPIFMGAG